MVTCRAVVGIHGTGLRQSTPPQTEKRCWTLRTTSSYPGSYLVPWPWYRRSAVQIPLAEDDSSFSPSVWDALLGILLAIVPAKSFVPLMGECFTEYHSFCLCLFVDETVSRRLH